MLFPKYPISIWTMLQIDSEPWLEIRSYQPKCHSEIGMGWYDMSQPCAVNACRLSSSTLGVWEFIQFSLLLRSAPPPLLLLLLLLSAAVHCCYRCSCHCCCCCCCCCRGCAGVPTTVAHHWRPLPLPHCYGGGGRCTWLNREIDPLCSAAFRPAALIGWHPHSQQGGRAALGHPSSQ